tara:strand:- start:8116 stop:8853 length:738 start_codon:yes stop_codon:yes gene_type:complete
MRAVITFHSIDDTDSVLSYSAATLHSLIKGLISSNIPIVSISSLLADKQKAGVSFTFDDGVENIYTHVLPLMKRYRFPAHLFLTTSTIGKNNKWPTQPSGSPCFQMLTWDQIGELAQAGMKVEAHTDTHPWLTRLKDKGIIEECETANVKIEQYIGAKPEFFAYPYGDYDNRVSKLVNTIYAASFTTELAFLSANSSPNQLPRLDSFYLKSPYIHNNLDSLIARSYINSRQKLRQFKALTKCILK